MKHALSIAILLFAFCTGIAGIIPLELLPKDPKFGSHQPNGGANGGPAYHITRTNPEEYHLADIDITKMLKPNCRYRITLDIRTENVINARPKTGGAAIAVEFSNATKYLGGPHPHGILGTQEQQLSVEFTSPEQFTKAKMLFYLRPHATGDAWFSTPEIMELKPLLQAVLIAPRYQYSATPGKQQVILHLSPVGVKSEKFDAVLVQKDKVIAKEQISPVGNRICFEADIPEGDSLIRVSLPGGTLAETIPLHAIKLSKQRAVSVDNRGILRVDGKKYLPVGLFTNFNNDDFASYGYGWREQDFENLGKSPFNCVMPYDSSRGKRSGKTPSLAETEAIIARLNSMNIKTIFSVEERRPGTKTKITGDKEGLDAVEELVLKFKDNPGILGWYVNDERPVLDYDLKRKALIGKLDPDHPMWQIMDKVRCVHGNYPISDIMGVDPYPLHQPDSGMESLEELVNAAVTLGELDGDAALWVAPQAFNWHEYSSYRPDVEPLEKHIRSMALMSAVLGAKGFIFYTYSSTYRSKRGFDARWKDLCDAGSILRRLENHILGDTPRKTLDVKSSNGKVRAALFTNDKGEKAVVIVSGGPEKVEAEFTVPGVTGLKSVYGNTRELGNGRYRFDGSGMDSDVLFQ